MILVPMERHQEGEQMHQTLTLKRFQDHVGTGPDSFHNTTVKRCDNLMKPNQSIDSAIGKQHNITKEQYLIRLNTSIDVVIYLLHQGLAFRGHDESEKSKNQGNFRELVKLLAKQNDKRNKALGLGNAKMTKEKSIRGCVILL
jgi:hypothetical protein